MPTYVYECPKCKEKVEVVQSITNRVPPVCCKEDCNIEMESVISPSTFVLKGSGWAKDGYSGRKG